MEETARSPADTTRSDDAASRSAAACARSLAAPRRSRRASARSEAAPASNLPTARSRASALSSRASALSSRASAAFVVRFGCLVPVIADPVPVIAGLARSLGTSVVIRVGPIVVAPHQAMMPRHPPPDTVQNPATHRAQPHHPRTPDTQDIGANPTPTHPPLRSTPGQPSQTRRGQRRTHQKAGGSDESGATRRPAGPPTEGLGPDVALPATSQIGWRAWSAAAARMSGSSSTNRTRSRQSGIGGVFHEAIGRIAPRKPVGGRTCRRQVRRGPRTEAVLSAGGEPITRLDELAHTVARSFLLASLRRRRRHEDVAYRATTPHNNIPEHRGVRVPDRRVGGDGEQRDTERFAKRAHVRATRLIPDGCDCM